MLLPILKQYARLHSWAHKSLNVNIRGLGFLYRRLRHDHVIQVKGNKMFLNHRIADNYGRLINNDFNEPETHTFIDACIAPFEKGTVQFVEVGANIGEFVVDYSANPRIANVLAFEPQPVHWATNQEHIKLNNFSNTRVIQKAVSDEIGVAYFNFKHTNASASGLVADGRGTEVQTTTLDYEISNKTSNTIFLIDVEGAELKVLKGARGFIKEYRPLIIFEYNFVSKAHFNLDDIQGELGGEYEIFRLNAKGTLDKDLSDTWNMVALPAHNFNHVQKLIAK